MDNSLLLGLLRYTVPVPRSLWQRQITRRARHLTQVIDFMTPEHHLIRNYVVREIPRSGRPLAPENISQELKIQLNRVVEILADLERHMTFLFRNERGEVIWAYPVTTEKTPHRVVFSTGEQVYAA